MQISSDTRVTVGKGATVMLSENIFDYVVVGDKYIDTCNNEVGRAAFCAQNKSNIEIIGEKNAIINGKGLIWQYNNNFTKRPYVIRLVNCKNVRISNLVIVDTPSCAISLVGCENVVVEHITVLSTWSANNDAIDVDGCNGVTIKDCVFDTGDDCVALKTTKDLACKNIVVQNCEFNSNISAFKIGTESVGDFENVVLKDSVIKKAGMCAIKILPTDGGLVNNVLISNIKMTNVTGPIFVSNGKRMRRFFNNVDRKNFSSISDLTIENISAEVSVPLAINAKIANACFVVSGTVENRLKNLTIKNCSINMPGGITNWQNTEKVAEMGAGYPEFYSLGLAPASCLYLRHVDGLTFSENNFTVKDVDVREKVVFDDVNY